MPLSDKQMTYLALAWQCFESEPKIDYEKFKDVAGLASAHSARELMRVTKNKLKSEYGALSGDIKTSNSKTATPKKSTTKSASSTPATGKKRGKKAQEDVEAHGGSDEDEPAKKRRSPVKQEVAEDEDAIFQ